MRCHTPWNLKRPRAASWLSPNMQYKERLDQAEARFNELSAKMTDPAVINDSDQYRKVPKHAANWRRWWTSTPIGNVRIANCAMRA
jgi:hypothetical protein